MAYKPIQWVDHVVDESGTVIQQGTLLNAENFNFNDLAVLESNIINEMVAQNIRWERDKADDAKVTQFEVTITTANTATTVDISTAKRNRTSYNVTYELITLTGGTAGDILISDKQVNGFKAKYNGTATSIKVLFKLQGGMI